MIAVNAEFAGNTGFTGRAVESAVTVACAGAVGAIEAHAIPEAGLPRQARTPLTPVTKEAGAAPPDLHDGMRISPGLASRCRWSPPFLVIMSLISVFLFPTPSVWLIEIGPHLFLILPSLSECVCMVWYVAQYVPQSRILA